MHLHSIYGKECFEVNVFILFVFLVFVDFVAAGFQKLSVCLLVESILVVNQILWHFCQGFRKLYLIFIDEFVYIHLETFCRWVFNVRSVLQEQHVIWLKLVLHHIRNLSWVIAALIHYIRRFSNREMWTVNLKLW
jgi:hypothetical protein